MKGQKFFPLFLLAAFPFFTLAQDTPRNMAPEQAVDLQKGRLADFEYYLYRFDTALEENELKSMEALRKELVKMMQNEITFSGMGQTGKTEPNSPEAWLKTANTGDLAKAPAVVSTAFHAFKNWMKNEGPGLIEKTTKQ